MKRGQGEVWAAVCQALRRDRVATYAQLVEATGCKLSSIANVVCQGVREGWLDTRREPGKQTVVRLLVDVPPCVPSRRGQGGLESLARMEPPPHAPAPELPQKVTSAGIVQAALANRTALERAWA